MHFRYFLAVFELLSDSLTAIYVELHRCLSHHSILLTQGRIWEIFENKFWEFGDFKKWAFFESAILNFFFEKKNFFFCFIPMKISPNLYGRMDGSKFWCFPWFPENSLLCVILCYTVYVLYFGSSWLDLANFVSSRLVSAHHCSSWLISARLGTSRLVSAHCGSSCNITAFLGLLWLDFFFFFSCPVGLCLPP